MKTGKAISGPEGAVTVITGIAPESYTDPVPVAPAVQTMQAMTMPQSATKPSGLTDVQKIVVAAGIAGALFLGYRFLK